MDVSIGLLGLAMIVGSVLIFSEFSFSSERRERGAANAGFACMGLGGAGAVLVAAFPRMPIPLTCTRWERPWQSALANSQF
jgi:hypothetical protein